MRLPVDGKSLALRAGAADDSPRPPGSSHSSAQLAALVAIAVLLVLLPSDAANAHGVGALESSNFASRVAALVTPATPDAGREEQTPADPVDGLTWRVLGGDAYLEVTNRTGRDLVVLGYDLEPYLRIGPAGVFENRHSPTTYLNRERYPTRSPPEDADPRRPPEWVRVSNAPTYAWHDHRMQWMGGDLPAAVSAAPNERHEVARWVVPFDLGERELGVAGELVWVPPPSVAPWILAALALVTAPTALAVWRATGRTAGRVAGATVIVAAVVAAAVSVDEALSAVHASSGDVAIATAPAAAGVLAGLAGGGAAWRRSSFAAPALVLGGAALLALTAYPDLEVLTTSQMLTHLPTWLVRMGVALGLVVAAPAVLGAWTLARDARSG